MEVTKGFPVKTVTVESSNPKISAKVEAVKQDEAYRIIVTPGTTDQPVMAILSIKTDYPPENPKMFYAHIRVQPKNEASIEATRGFAGRGCDSGLGFGMGMLEARKVGCFPGSLGASYGGLAMEGTSAVGGRTLGR